MTDEKVSKFYCSQCAGCFNEEGHLRETVHHNKDRIKSIGERELRDEVHIE